MMAAIALAAIGVAGCRPLIMPVSSAPPGREAAIDQYSSNPDTIHLSKGVALGVECRSGSWFSPCEGASARTSNGEIARVMRGHLDKFRSPYGYTDSYESDASHRSVFIVMGVEAGETDLTIDSEDGARHFKVIVDP
jgi:hypothetical protein